MHRATPEKIQHLKRITPVARRQTIGEMANRGFAASGEAPAGLLLVGDSGVACHELGEVLGVCAEAPLPRISVMQQDYSLSGVCGIASLLQNWGLAPIVSCPLGHGQASVLQRRLLAKARVSSVVLSTGLPQISRYIRRIFASGHQLAHLEAEEAIPSASPLKVKRGLNALVRRLKGARLLCIVDQGNAGLNENILVKLTASAKAQGVQVLYEPRCPQLPSCRISDVVKINHNQVKQWFGTNSESDRQALMAAQRVLARTGATSVVYTRGARGILVLKRSRRGYESFHIVPEPKKIYDLVSAGDVVTAALAFCLTKGYSLLEAVCLAATAAELSLDQRYDKHINLQSILRNRNNQ